MVGMEVLTIGTGVVATLALLLSLGQTWKLALLATHQPGIGRVIFWSIASLKVWAALVLIFFMANTLYPGWAGDNAYIRVGIRLTLGVYLVVQTVAVNIAVWRWGKSDYTGQPVARSAQDFFDYIRALAHR